MTPPLYSASVPVFLHYLGQAEALLAKIKASPDILQASLAPDMLSCGRQFASAAGFALRGTYPLLGQPVPDFARADMDHSGLMARLRFAAEALKTLEPADFEGAESRRVRHRAGFAELEQSGVDYLNLFALPNFFFHLGMGFAIMRQGGFEIGKSDFDGLHDYPQGFSF